MNNRAQAGTGGLQKGIIELMQNRRLIQDDNKGVMEILNETDPNGVGIKTNAKYYVQIFDYVKGVSKQRQQQMLIDSPLQYFFSFEQFNQSSKPTSYQSKLQFGAENAQTSKEQTQVQSLVKFTDVSTESLIYRAFPLGRNKILVRFENVADRFDAKGQETKFIDVQAFAKNFQLDALKGKATNAASINF